jgi:hypothetical protein
MSASWPVYWPCPVSLTLSGVFPAVDGLDLPELTLSWILASLRPTCMQFMVLAVSGMALICTQLGTDVHL